MRISDWSSDVCSSDLCGAGRPHRFTVRRRRTALGGEALATLGAAGSDHAAATDGSHAREEAMPTLADQDVRLIGALPGKYPSRRRAVFRRRARSAELRVGQEWLSPCMHRWWTSL